MSHYKSSINLSRLLGATLETGADGKRFLAIPVDESNLFVTERGDCYLNLVHWESRYPDDKGYTHSVKQSFNQQFAKDNPDTVRNMPALGRSKPLPQKQGDRPQNNPYQPYPRR